MRGPAACASVRTDQPPASAAASATPQAACTVARREEKCMSPPEGCRAVYAAECGPRSTAAEYAGLNLADARDVGRGVRRGAEQQRARAGQDPREDGADE